MANQLNVPAESWRAPPRGIARLDPQLVRIGVVAAGVAGVLALGFGGYALMGHRSLAIPVVEADTRPIRIRPVNPGGAMVEGAEEQIMGGHGHGQADAMAPAPEAPAPLALRAQIDGGRPPQAALPVSLAAPPAPVPSPVSDMPESKPLARPAPHPAVASAAPAAGGMQVQFAALDSEQAAMTEWQRLSRRMPDLLGPRRPAVMRADRDGKTIWRLRTGGFSDVPAATAFCAQVRSKGGGCAIASF